jgi:hypothetical protein
MHVGVTQPDTNDDFGAETETEYLTRAVPTDAGFPVIKEEFTFDGTGMVPGDPLSIIVFREPNNASDDTGDDQYLHTVMIEEA